MYAILSKEVKRGNKHELPEKSFQKEQNNMLTSNQELVMINHILTRRKKHLARLEKENAELNVVQTWGRFYQRLLVKYNFYEVSSYENNRNPRVST